MQNTLGKSSCRDGWDAVREKKRRPGSTLADLMSVLNKLLEHYCTRRWSGDKVMV